MTDTMGKFGTHSMGNIATFFISTLKNKLKHLMGHKNIFSYTGLPSFSLTGPRCCNSTVE